MSSIAFSRARAPGLGAGGWRRRFLWASFARGVGRSCAVFKFLGWWRGCGIWEVRGGRSTSSTLPRAAARWDSEVSCCQRPLVGGWKASVVFVVAALPTGFAGCCLPSLESMYAILHRQHCSFDPRTLVHASNRPIRQTQHPKPPLPQHEKKNEKRKT